MKKLMSTIGVIALLMGTSFAQDAAPSKEMRQGKQGKHQAMLQELPGLTENQKAQIKDIREESREKMEPQREEMKKLRAKMMELKSAENPDQEQINRLIDEQAKLKAQMEKTRTASELKVRELLTPEQRKVFDAQQKEKMQKREKSMSEKKTMMKAQ